MVSLYAALCFVIACVASPSPDAAALLERLDALMLAEDARKLLEPHMEDVKKLDPAVIEKIVYKQWWGVAQDIVAKAHLQNVDLSFAVRRAVKALKEEADELLRTLNPKYGQAQLVAPAFQWAQNDTCVFLTVKFTVRWNAPGALEVSDPEVHTQDNTFNFTGLGKHSNNKYKYHLSLSFFDNIMGLVWSTASVGRLSATLQKKVPRKWPRLLQDKKTKIKNMHVWMETQDRLQSQLSGLSTVSHSPVTCGVLDKFYCSVTDSCKLAANCSQCPGKPEPSEAEHLCAGVPAQKATVSFKDNDFDRNELGGTIKITKAQYDVDSAIFAIYWGKTDWTKLDINGVDAPVLAEVSAHGYGSDFHFALNLNTKKPENATHLLVFSKNTYGEYSTPGFVALKDAFLPEVPPKGITFQDEDGGKGAIKGDVNIDHAEDQTTIEQYSLYWGKSATQRVDKKRNKAQNTTESAFLADVDKAQKSYFMGENTRYPEQATHLLVYSKNEYGEHPTPVAVEIVDVLKPCLQVGDDDCPSGVTVTASEDGRTTLSIQRAKTETGIVAYILYWGRAACEDDGERASNGHLRYLAVEGSLDYELPTDIEVPDLTTHILAFSQNQWGESNMCVSTHFVVDNSATNTNINTEIAEETAHTDQTDTSPHPDNKEL